MATGAGHRTNLRVLSGNHELLGVILAHLERDNFHIKVRKARKEHRLLLYTNRGTCCLLHVRHVLKKLVIWQASPRQRL